MKINFRTLKKKLLVRYLSNVLDETKSIRFFNWTTEQYLIDMPMKWITSRAIYVDEKLAGVSINSVKGSSLHIHIFLVFESFRHNRLGQQLLLDVVNVALMHNLNEITLKCSSENVSALVFYLNNEFRITDFNSITRLLSLRRALLLN